MNALDSLKEWYEKRASAEGNFIRYTSSKSIKIRIHKFDTDSEEEIRRKSQARIIQVIYKKTRNKNNEVRALYAGLKNYRSYLYFVKRRKVGNLLTEVLEAYKHQISKMPSVNNATQYVNMTSKKKTYFHAQQKSPNLPS